MAKLTERYVQNCALNHLKIHYEEQNPNTLIYARTELVTKYKKKRGIADGLLAFKKNDGRIYTVSLEAKSHKTSGSLKNIALDKRLLACLCLSFILMATVTWFILGTISWWLKIIIALIVGLLSGTGILALLYSRQHFDTNGIIEQVKRYPADEKWVAISIDAFSACNQYNREMLIYKAQSLGFGSLVVSSGNKVDVKLGAKSPKNTVPKSFICYYKIYETIIRFLDRT